MASILDTLPLLEVLDMRTPCALDLSENWLLETKRQHSRNLRSLILVNTLVPQENLEDLISISLGLEEFKLMLCEFHGRSPLDFDAKRFYKHLQSLLLSDLEALQFSNKDTHLLYPSKATYWVFRGFQFTLDIIDLLATLPNNVTTLEILGPCESLNHYLCFSPHLLHLKAPWTDLKPQYMDLHLCWDYGFGVFRRCTSGLASTREETTPMKPTVSVFGYIARVRPLLQDLVIYGPESRPITRGVSNLHETLGLDLPNGLCILSNLKHLQHLQIGERYMEISVKSIDVDWMLPSGHSEDKVLERKKAMARWVDMVQNDLRLLSLNLTSVRQLAGGVLDIPELEPELAFKL
ncbi:hypothetical protein BGX33_000445 [Mortierella sp. NVP41]|nr:hypothetical protein BGX33_000445 [Mortierella sp. NVP41]